MWDSRDGVILLDKMSETGEISDGMLKTIKKICKASPENLNAVFERIFENMKKKSFSRKLVAIKVLNELFRKSATVRDKTMSKYYYECNLNAQRVFTIDEFFFIGSQLCESNSSEAIEDIDLNSFGGQSLRLRLLTRRGFEVIG